MTFAGSSRWLRAFLAGLAQLVFCSTLPAGVLVALGLGLLSPWVLTAAAGGCLLGTLSGRFLPGVTREDRAAGLMGFNPAILGIVGAGALEAGGQETIWLLLALLACIALAWAMIRPLARLGLFPLSAPAYLVAVVASLILAPPGAWWWPSADTTAFGAYAPWIALACLAAAMSYEAVEAAGWAILSAALAYLVAVEAMNGQAADTIGLWGVVAPLSAFASIRLMGQRAAAGLALGTAAIATVMWLSWQASPLAVRVPPLIAPMVAALWFVMSLRGRRLPVLAQAAFWACLAALVRARWTARPVAVMTGPSPLETAAVNLELGAVRESEDGDWRELWCTADRLRHLPPGSSAAPFAAALQEAVKAGVFDLVIASDTVGQVDAIDEDKRIDGAGRADQLSCLACGRHAPWPPVDLWRRMTLRCTCGGVLLPDLRASDPSWERALAAEVAERLGDAPAVLFVLDGPGGETRASRSLVDRVLAKDGQVFWVATATSGPGQGSEHERLILGNAALALRTLAGLSRLSPRRRRGHGASATSRTDARTTP